MYKVVLTGLIVALSGCATQYQAAGQNYRLKGAENPVNIQGKINTSLVDKPFAEISFNGEKKINVPLDWQYYGEATGDLYEGKPTSATCSTTKRTSYNIEVRCMVFVDNEKTVTLTF